MGEFWERPGGELAVRSQQQTMVDADLKGVTYRMVLSDVEAIQGAPLMGLPRSIAQQSVAQQCPRGGLAGHDGDRWPECPSSRLAHQFRDTTIETAKLQQEVGMHKPRTPISGGGTPRQVARRRRPSLRSLFVGSLFVLFGLLLGLYLSALAQDVLAVDGHNFKHLGPDYNHDGTSIWSYRVTSGSASTPSHWVLELDPALKTSNIAATWKEYAVGNGKATGLYGFKFDEGYEDGETREVDFTLGARYAATNTRVGSKAEQDIEVGEYVLRIIYREGPSVLAPIMVSRQHKRGFPVDPLLRVTMRTHRERHSDVGQRNREAGDRDPSQLDTLERASGTRMLLTGY